MCCVVCFGCGSDGGVHLALRVESQCRSMAAFRSAGCVSIAHLSSFLCLEQPGLHGHFTVAHSGPATCRLATTADATAGQQEHAKQWLVASAVGGKEASRLAQQLTQQGRGPVPWAGIAAPLAEPSAPAHIPAEPAADAEGPGRSHASSSSSTTSVAAAASAGLQGRAFCFLPLPLPTGLPVHVNGLFEYVPSIDPGLAV